MRAWLSEPLEAASLRVFRFAFGVALFAAAARFWAKGWIESVLVAPSFHFHYFGFHWVRPLPGAGMYVVFALWMLAAAGVALGVLYRASIVTLFVTFTYVELCEKAAYLNHYYLVSLLALLLAFFPATGGRAPRFALLALRLQLALVYFYAGLAKLDPDWLFEAQPLRLWLGARSDVALLGPLLSQKATAYVVAWAGALFDLSAPFALSWRRTRGPFFVLVVVFHVLTALLFPSIGLFPWLMIAFATIFFPPDWPLRLGLRGLTDGVRVAPLSRLGLAALGAYFALQVLVPLRHLAYPGKPGWTDEGFRWAWRVMIVDKVGTVTFRAHERGGPRRFYVSPAEYLTPFQERQMAQSPDMILELAHHIGRELGRRHGVELEVYADAWVSLNGRPSARLIDPQTDLMRERDSLAPAPWILPRD